MKLVIARPSPYARKARIALLEKGIAFETIVENPWQPETTVPNVNPLGKVPALILDGGRVIHDSKVIVEYLETLGAPPDLIPKSPDLRVAHKQLEAIADGVCDAVVLITLELARAPELRSVDWIERQRQKVVAGVTELARLLGNGEWFTSAGFGLGEIATVCALDYIDLRLPAFDWRPTGASLANLHARLSVRPSFAQTKPESQALPQVR
jgi:glutathione S-transferase